jgi:hypothetical protein
MSDYPKLLVHSYVKHTLNQSSFVLLASYAFDALVNNRTSSITLFINLIIVKFLNDYVLRSAFKSYGGSSNRRPRGGIFSNVIPHSQHLSQLNTPQNIEGVHSYYTPSGTITLMTFYFTYLLFAMVQRKEINPMRIIMYIVIMILLSIFKMNIGTPTSAIFLGLVFGVIFGIILSYIVGAFNINALPSGINQERQYGQPVVKCSISEN